MSLCVCRMLMFFRTFGFYESSCILMVISTDRYLSIRHSMNAQQANRRGKKLLVASWVFSALASAPQVSRACGVWKSKSIRMQTFPKGLQEKLKAEHADVKCSFSFSGMRERVNWFEKPRCFGNTFDWKNGIHLWQFGVLIIVWRVSHLDSPHLAEPQVWACVSYKFTVRLKMGHHCGWIGWLGRVAPSMLFARRPACTLAVDFFLCEGLHSTRWCLVLVSGSVLEWKWTKKENKQKGSFHLLFP